MKAQPLPSLVGEGLGVGSVIICTKLFFSGYLGVSGASGATSFLVFSVMFVDFLSFT